MMKKIYYFLLLTFSFFTLSGIIRPVQAFVDIGGEFGRGTFISGTIGQFTQITQLLNPFIATAYVLAGVLIFFVLLAGGFLVIMGAGQSDAKKLDQGKQAITWGLIGLIVVFTSYWLIKIVETITGLSIMTGAGY